MSFTCQKPLNFFANHSSHQHDNCIHNSGNCKKITCRNFYRLIWKFSYHSAPGDVSQEIPKLNFPFPWSRSLPTLLEISMSNLNVNVGIIFEGETYARKYKNSTCQSEMQHRKKMFIVIAIK